MAKTSKKTPSKALARRTTAARKPAPRIKRDAPTAAVAAAAPPPPLAPQQPALVPDTVQLGQLGLVELALTEKEETVLGRPVNVEDLRVKPNGAVYEPHPVLTRRLNEAFGRFGWSLVPAGMPQRVQAGPKRIQVVCAYVLHIHGKPVAYAMGEQDYFENSAEQSYGDALESTVASALRRCCKRIGIASELWDKPFVNDYLQRHAVKVAVKQKAREPGQQDTVKYQWRRKIDPPLPFEQSGGRQQEPGPVPPAGTHPKSKEPITDSQRKRLFTILRSSGRTEAELRQYLMEKFKVSSTTDITRENYDTVVQWVEHPTTPAPPVSADTIPWGHYRIEDDREPGEEG